jgi:hypothetical protein
MYRQERPYVKRQIRDLEWATKIFNPQMVELNQCIPSDLEELIYVANEEDEVLNHLFENHLGFMNRVANVFNLRIVYIPLLYQRIQEEEVQRYVAPDVHELINPAEIGNDYMFQYLANPKDRERMAHGFIWNTGDEDLYEGEPLKLEFFALSSSSKKSIPHQIYEIFSIVDHRRRGGPNCCIGGGYEAPEDYAENRFNSQLWGEDITDLMDEIKEKVEKLRQRGVAEQILMDLIRPQTKLSRLVISKDYKLILTDYHNMEIKMEPLVKAVYLLFLKHPEGIMFKELPDYRTELTEIYLQLKPNGLTERVKKSIEDVTDPTKNSINEKCARIRGAFLEQFDNHLAKHYYIDGLRAEPKMIALPRELVVWET